MLKSMTLTNVAAVLGTVATTAVTSGLLTFFYLSGPVYDRAFNAGMEFAVENLDIKKMMIDNQDFANAACHAWWFKSDGSERKLQQRPRK